MKIQAALLFALGLLAAGCSHVPIKVEHPESVSPGGVRWQDLFLGEGPAAQTGDTVVFDYVILLGDGTHVDSTLDRGVPLDVQLGKVQVEGLNQGIVGMRPGGRRRMRIPPELAYGSAGVPDLVPPNALLDCEVHLLEVHPLQR